MVAGLRREASTSRSAAGGMLQRLPAPARFGARSPWNRTSGNGAEWQRMQVDERSATSARPRAASPGVPVSESVDAVAGDGIGRECLCRRDQAEARPRRSTAMASSLAKGVHRDRLVTRRSAASASLARSLARRIDRAGAAAFDLGEDLALGLVDCRPARRHSPARRCCSRRLSAWGFRRLVRKLAAMMAAQALPCALRGRGRFRNAAAEAGIADDVDVGHELRGESHGIDRAPAGVIGGAGERPRCARPSAAG